MERASAASFGVHNRRLSTFAASGCGEGTKIVKDPELRAGSLLFRFRWCGLTSCMACAMASAAPKRLLSTISAWFTCRILSKTV